MKTGLTLIQTYGNPESAHIDAGMLRSNGISCEVVESAGSELFPAPYGGIGTTSIYAEADKAEEALRILKDSHD